MTSSGINGRKRRVLRLLWLAVVAAVWAGCGDGRTAVTVYSPHGRDLLQLMESAYEAQNPEIDIRWLDMGSQEVYDRIRSERANPQATVWFGGPAALFSRAAEEGLLRTFVPTWSSAVEDQAKDADGRFIALYRTPPLLVFNREAVLAEEAPTDWSDLLDERWAGEVIIRDPLASGTMRTIFGGVLARAVTADGSEDAGWSFLRSLDSQTKEYVHSPALLHEKLIRQEGLVTVWEMTDILSLVNRGAPIDFRFPTSGTPVIADSVALVDQAPEQEAAEAFVEWLGSEEALGLAAAEAFRLPARTDIPAASLPPWSERVLDELVSEEVDWDLIEERGADWMTTWDREVRGQGP